MSYKIAVASSDGTSVNLSFWEAEQFLIYEVDENGAYRLLEVRDWEDGRDKEETDVKAETGERLGYRGCRQGNCPAGGGCANVRKTSLLEDCRCVLCTEIGFRVQRQLASKAVSVFDINAEISDAFKKIIAYFDRID